MAKIPYMLIVGEKEFDNQTVSVRKQGQGDMGTMNLEQFKAFILTEIEQELTHKLK